MEARLFHPPKSSKNFPSILKKSYMMLTAEKKRGSRTQTEHPHKPTRKGRKPVHKPNSPPKLRQHTGGKAQNFKKGKKNNQYGGF